MERTVVYQPAPITSYVTQDELNSQLQSLNNSFRTIIYGNVSSASPYSVGGLYNEIALSNRINSLQNVAISNSTLTNTSGGEDSDDTLGSLSGLFSIAHGGTGTSSAPAANQLLLSDTNGNWEYVSTSSLGITGSFGGTGTTTLSNGLVVSGGCIFINGACLNPAGLTNYWSLSGSSLYNSQGTALGINTASPAYPLDVNGFINAAGNYGYKIGGQTVLTASSTSGLTLAGIGAGANLLATTSAVAGNTAFGYQALFNATSSAYNTAFGYQALKSIALTTVPGYNTAFGYEALSSVTAGGINNTGIGYLALSNNGGGNNNTALGMGALAANTGGYSNTAVGQNAMYNNAGGPGNTAVGQQALYNNTSGSSNTALGGSAGYNGDSASYRTLIGAATAVNNTGGASSTVVGTNAMAGSTCCYSNIGSTIVGASAGLNSGNNSNFNAFFGLYSGYNNTTGNDNSFFGAYSGQNMTVGANNIAIGWNALLPSASASNQLSIGNFIFGTGLTATTSSTTALPVPTGFLGIGTSTPYARLSVWGSDAASSTLAFNVINSASSTVFAVFDGGNAQLSGTLTQSSDKRLKTNVASLDASSSLAAINALTPVAYDWLDPEKDSVRQYGFIAQDVQKVFPNLVATTSATALTPDGTLGLNYIGLIAPLVEAVQTVSSQVANLAATVAGFASSFHTQQLCIGSTCINQEQLAGLLELEQQQGQVQIGAPMPPVISDGTMATDTAAVATDTPNTSQ